jgi:CDP-diacylglycerol---serine O-phosphatidyltransferase
MGEMMDIKKAGNMVPSLFTVANMALGFFAILAALDGRWIAAPVAIFVAHVMDVLDGRMARWMKVQSAFGGEFDSFADWMSFAIAPGFMIYLIALKDFHKWGFMLTFFYIFAGAYRLARFNVKSVFSGETSGLHFTGLPMPAAGGFLSVLVLLFGLYEQEHQGRTMGLLYQQIPHLREGIPVIVFSLAILMMSKVEYATFKKTRLLQPKSHLALLVTIFVFFMIYMYPQNTVFIIYSSYILWGLVRTGIRTYRLRINRNLTPAQPK